jgi:predicted ATPase/DNA-binding SARP family transcriptional activator
MDGEGELQFRVLGSLEATVAGRSVALGGPKPRSLLAALLVNANRVVSADFLVQVLWGDGAPELATSTVRKYVYGLRAALDPRRAEDGDRILMTRAPGYLLAVTPAQLDAAGFEQLVAEGQRWAAQSELERAETCFDESLALWRGPAFAEFADQEFARIEAARLESLRALAIESRAEVGLAAGRHAPLLAALEAAVAAYPLRERPRAQLMLALYRCGRQADALRAFQEFRRYLAEEVGLEPSPALQELDAAIAIRSSTLEWSSARPPDVRVGLPAGTVTFLFSDIEGSTRLWESAPEAMRKALARHDEILRWVVEAHSGYVFATGGDGLAAAFHRGGDALEAAVRAQQQLSAEPWPDAAPIRVRMGLHTGEVDERGGDYFGAAVNRAARVMAAGHGGQVLLSLTTASLVRGSLPSGAALVDVGVHRLRDLSEPEALFQVAHPDLSSSFPPLRTIDATAGNLPTQRSSFVGRTADLDRLTTLLEERRVVTLSGVGGVGKTRLAIQAAAELSDRFPGGVWLIELARTGDPTAIVAVARTALGASLSPGRSELEALGDHLGRMEALLVLDNCEHVLDAAAELVVALLERCPGVRVLCTSREPLDLAGEQVMPVRPLDPSGDAVVLLDQRAREVDPDLDVLVVERPSALEICRRLDGVPLAIELAAARASTMTLDEIARGLDDRFRLLGVGRRRSVERHRTLQTAVDWSHQLLNEPAQRLFRRLAAFAGGFDADAARAVAVLPAEGLDVDAVLASLVRCSMVQRDRTPAGTRYRLLETIRSYAHERLAEAGEATTVGRAHAEWVVTLVDIPFEVWATAGSGLYQRFAMERDNWREAVGFALTNRMPHLAVRLLSSMGCGEMDEAGALAAAALALEGVEDVPGYHWLHWTIAGRGAIEGDVELLRHVALFDARCPTPQERAHGAPYLSVLAMFTGAGSALAPIEEALALPGLSPQLRAYLEHYRSLWSNFPEGSDIEAARRALRMAEDVNSLWVPLVQAFLAVALRRDHPDEALAVARKALEADLDALGPYSRALVSSTTAIAVSEVPVRAAVAHLRDGLAGLQARLTGAEMGYFAVCAKVLARAGHPAAAVIRSFVVNHDLTSFYAILLPDLLEASAPQDASAVIEVVRSALDDLLSTPTET